jgi:hypothetical protein
VEFASWPEDGHSSSGGHQQQPEHAHPSHGIPWWPLRAGPAKNDDVTPATVKTTPAAERAATPDGAAVAG